MKIAYTLVFTLVVVFDSIEFAEFAEARTTKTGKVSAVSVNISHMNGLKYKEGTAEIDVPAGIYKGQATDKEIFGFVPAGAKEVERLFFNGKMVALKKFGVARPRELEDWEIDYLKTVHYR